MCECDGLYDVLHDVLRSHGDRRIHGDRHSDRHDDHHDEHGVQQALARDDE